MNESTETMNATGADPIAELHRAPNGRRALRYAEMSRWQVFRLPRATDRGGRRSRVDVTAGMAVVVHQSERGERRRERAEDWVYDAAREMAGKMRGRFLAPVIPTDE